MKLNDFFEHIYCINLDRRPDRWEACQEEFDRIGIEVERVSATDGEAAFKSNATWIDELGLLPGEYGVLESNSSVLFDAREKGYNSILILEDDIQFSETFNKDWDNWCSEIPDNWEMLYLGGNLVGWQPSPIAKHVHKGEGIFAVHALGLRGAALNGIGLFPKDGPVDVQYARKSTNYNSYIMIPRLAYQRNDWSDIQNKPSEYWFLRSGQWDNVMRQI